MVKVEPPAGDEARSWGPPFAGGLGTLFVAANSGKRSVALDLRRGTDVVLRLVDGADVFIQSLRPGLADELGLGAEALRARKPELVHCTISSYGREGPKAKLPGYDPLLQAAAGLISVTGEPGRDGVRIGVSLIDHTTGMYAAFAILAAVHAGGGRDARRLALGDRAVVRLLPPDRHARDAARFRPRRGRRSTRSRRTRCFPPPTAG